MLYVLLQKFPFLIICCFFFPSQGIAQKQVLETEKTELIQLEYNWLKAEFALDTNYLSNLMDERFMGINVDAIHNKQEALMDMYTGIAQRNKDSIFIDSFKLEDIHINIFENTAVVCFVVHTYRKEKGIAHERRTMFYDVWIKRNKKWKAVSSQGTRISN
jgi:hypothetical protein